MISLDLPEFLTSTYWTPNKGPELAEKWRNIIIISSILYVPLILLGQKIMQSRRPFSLKKVLLVWNIGLAFLSLLGSLIIILTDYKVLSYVFYDEKNYTPGTRAVIALFTLTKAIEFGDTIILVLKKKEIVFLHLYHHFSVTLYCWHAQYINIYFGHYFAFINLCIHSIMYTYYGLTTIFPGNRFLKFFRPYITLSQTLQMFVGVVLSYIAMVSNILPPIHIFNAECSLLMYISYAILFSKFYIENYFKSYRPFVTIYFFGIHLLAIAGLIFLIQSQHFIRLLSEVGVGYFTTGFILWFSMKYQSANSYKNSNSKSDQSSENFSKSYLSSIGNICLLILNCLAVWVKDHAFLKLFVKSNNNFTSASDDQALEERKHTDNSIVGDNLSSFASSTSTARQRNLSNLNSPLSTCSPSSSTASLASKGSPTTKSSSPPTIKKFNTTSIFISYLNKPSQKFPTDINQKKRSEKSHKKSSLARPIGFEDLWLIIICCIAPAIYGLNFYGDFFLGLCVHGALRWVIELHSTKFLLNIMYNPPYSLKAL